MAIDPNDIVARARSMARGARKLGMFGDEAMMLECASEIERLRDSAYTGRAGVSDLIEHLDKLAEKADTGNVRDVRKFLQALGHAWPQIRDRLRAAEAVCTVVEKHMTPRDHYTDIDLGLRAWRRHVEPAKNEGSNG